MLNVVCFWWNNWCGIYGPRYVTNLYENILKNTTIPFDFYCITDKPERINQKTIKFNPVFKWNLNKLLVFDMGLSGRIITIDLDTILLGNIDFVLEDSSKFIVNESFGDKGQCGGGIVSTIQDYGSQLLNILKSNYKQIEQETKGSERFFYRKYIENPQFWQRKYPGIYSYKKHCLNGIPKDAKIINFHGNPRPHEKGRNFFC